MFKTISDFMVKIQKPVLYPILLIVPIVVVVFVGIFYLVNGNVAARINGQPIYKNDFERKLEGEKKYQKDYQKISFEGTEGEKKEKDLMSKIFDQMVEEEVIKQELNSFGMKIAETDIDKEYEEMAKSSGGDEKFQKTINDYYGFTKDEFKKYKLSPKVYREKLQEKALSSTKLDGDAKNKIDETYKQLQNGADFSEIAKKYSEDNTSSSKGGDLGFVEKGQMVQEIEKQAFSLSVGSFSAPFKTSYGYHIIKVTEKDGDKTRLSQIITKTESFTGWINKMVNSAKVNKYIKI